MLVTSNVVTKEEVTAAIQELAGRLERRPTLPEVCGALKTNSRQVRKLFGTYARAVQASGLVPLLKGTLTTESVLEDWRTVVRKLKKIPTVHEYEFEGRHSIRPLKDRFGSWKDVPAGMLEFGDRRQLWAGWEDVRELAQRYVDEKLTSTAGPRQIFTSEPVDVHLLYGEPLTESPTATAPTNELGVVLLFGALARKLGFVVLKIQPGFPDCEALKKIENNRWQRVRIEFEFESRNFLDHGHDPQGCDLIVCWEHNWEGCANQVLELSKVVRNASLAAGY